ncbi:MAG: hypothetical protein K1X88_19925 [Nannocystaceae bacterium]|nr:hypothetical protein [Nannocystaceae bacterium]
MSAPGRSGEGRAATRRPPRRTAFTQTRGAITTWGQTEIAAGLAAALAAAAGGEPDTLTHGVHVYPARMHPAIARAIARRWVGERTRVLDPFCGSGTVLLEAMLCGGITTGVDLNPLGLRIAALKCERTDAARREAVAAAAARVTEAALQGVRARAKVLAPLPAGERAYYEPHVLRELAVLHRAILDERDAALREPLLLVFSALVGKFSRQRADTRDETVAKTIGKSVPTRFFARRVEALCERWAQTAQQLPPGVPPPRLHECDVRRLHDVVPAASIDVVITSPPYVGTYDYVDHHARRWAWLGISPKRLREGELGARRHYGRGGSAARWQRELDEVVRGTLQVLAPGGLALWLVGDGEIDGARIDAVAQLGALVPAHGSELVATASQPRIDWRGGRPRAEHLIALRRRA